MEKKEINWWGTQNPKILTFSVKPCQPKPSPPRPATHSAWPVTWLNWGSDESVNWKLLHLIWNHMFKLLTNSCLLHLIRAIWNGIFLFYSDELTMVSGCVSKVKKQT